MKQPILASFILSKIPSARTESAFRKKVIKMLHGRFVHMGKALTDLQILACELHQNAFGGRAPSAPQDP